MTSSVNSVEAFLASQKRFRCDRLNADLTEAQCDYNRKRQPQMNVGITKILACENCPGLIKGGAMPSERPLIRVCVQPGCDKWKVIGDYCTKHAKEHGVVAVPVVRDEATKRQMQLDKVAKMQAAKKAKRAAPVVETEEAPLPDKPRPVLDIVHINKIIDSVVASTVPPVVVAEPAVKTWRICIVDGCDKWKKAGSYCLTHAREKGVKKASAPIRAGHDGVVLCDLGIELDRLFREKRAEFLADLAGAASVKTRAKMFLGMCDSLEGLVY